MSAKKSFTDNPALRFITPARPPQGPAGKPAADSGPPLKPNPLYVETRSKRLQLLIQPSLHLKLKAIAQARGRSLNDLIHTLLEEVISQEDEL